jgi:hypothetical protein
MADRSRGRAAKGGQRMRVEEKLPLLEKLYKVRRFGALWSPQDFENS